MSSGVQRSMYGSFVGTGSAIDIKTVGFRPSKVELINVTDPTTLVWTRTMKDAAGFKSVVAGTMSFVTSNGVTPLADGFRLGADSDMNVAAQTVHWIATE